MPPAPPSFEFLLLCTFGCNYQSSNTNLVAASSIEEEQEKISSSNSLS